MSRIDLRQITSILDEMAHNHLVGNLQQIRAGMVRGQRLASKTIFSPSTIHEDEGYAYHYGGRHELQFNVGFEQVNRQNLLRYGVAFSFTTSPSLYRVEDLMPRVHAFNDFLRIHQEHYADLDMWHYKSDERSLEYTPGPIHTNLAAKGNFVFLGERQSIEVLDYERILTVFDRLMPLYKYVESEGLEEPIIELERKGFEFQPGYPERRTLPVRTIINREVAYTFRHNILQEALVDRLSNHHGEDNVGFEQSSGTGMSIDVVVQSEDEYWFYEIKTYKSPRACLREAVGQLLEYSFWPGSQEASRLIVVGESPLDFEGTEYLKLLRSRFNLPIEYMHLEIPFDL